VILPISKEHAAAIVFYFQWLGVVIADLTTFASVEHFFATIFMYAVQSTV
jgi:hypothetical protein